MMNSYQTKLVSVGNGGVPNVESLYLWSKITKRKKRKNQDSDQLRIFVPLKNVNFQDSCSHTEISAYAEFIDCDAHAARLFYPSFCHYEYKTAQSTVNKYKEKWRSGLAMDGRLKTKIVACAVEESVLISYLLWKTVNFLNNKCDLQFALLQQQQHGEKTICIELYCMHDKFLISMNDSQLSDLSGTLFVNGGDDEESMRYMDQVGYFAVVSCKKLCGIKPPSEEALPLFDEKVTHHMLCQRISEAQTNPSYMRTLIQEIYSERKSSYDLMTSVTKLGELISVSASKYITYQ